MAKNVKKSDSSFKGLLISIVIAVAVYLLILVVFSGESLASSNLAWVVAVHDHTRVVLPFITDYGFILVLVAIGLMLLYMFKKGK